MNIVWTKNALQDANKAYQYAAEKFEQSQVTRLTERIYSAEERIKKFPDACPLEQSLLYKYGRTFRYITLFKNIELIFHRESDDVCIIDAIWDTRQNPLRLKSKMN